MARFTLRSGRLVQQTSVDPLRSARVKHVLGVIVDGEQEARRTFEAALELADNGRARLTLAKTCGPGPVFASFGPLGAHATLIPPDDDALEMASRAITGLAVSVPGHIPLSTFVLGPDTQKHLARLLLTGAYDALVAPAGLVATSRGLRCGGRYLGHVVTAVPSMCVDQESPGAR